MNALTREDLKDKYKIKFNPKTMMFAHPTSARHVGELIKTGVLPIHNYFPMIGMVIYNTTDPKPHLGMALGAVALISELEELIPKEVNMVEHMSFYDRFPKGRDIIEEGIRNEKLLFAMLYCIGVKDEYANFLRIEISKMEGVCIYVKPDIIKDKNISIQYINKESLTLNEIEAIYPIKDADSQKVESFF